MSRMQVTFTVQRNMITISVFRRKNTAKQKPTLKARRVSKESSVSQLADKTWIFWRKQLPSELGVVEFSIPAMWQRHALNITRR